jgi:hypothetical protein
MSIYDINYIDRDNELTPPKYRLSKFLSWLNCLNYPLQWLRDNWFGEYKQGSTANKFIDNNFYTTNDKVIWIDSSVYIFILPYPEFVTIGLNAPTGDPDSAITWQKIQDVFIGVDERVRYSSQIIVLEFALNRFYQVPSIDPQIYIQNNTVANNVFVMGNSGATSSNMVNDSVFAETTMFNSPTFPAYLGNFTVYVPSALFATLGTTTQNRENNIRQFVDKYRLAGIKYNVLTF